MSIRKTGSLSILATAFTLLSLVTQPGFGGAITSANAPPMPPTLPIPGIYRLSCNVNVASFFALDSRTGADLVNVAETDLEYEKLDGQNNFTCIEGCEKLNWRKHSQFPAGVLLPESNKRKYADVRLPTLRLEMVDSNLILFAHVATGHRSWAGNLITSSQTKQIRFGQHEFQAHAETFETIDSSQLRKLRRMAKVMKRELVTSARGSTSILCTMLQPGQLSKAKTQQMMLKAPRAGSLSADEFNDATAIDKITQPFSKFLELARKLDPDHRKAMIAEFKSLRRNNDFLIPLAAKVRETVEQNPSMTGENVWAYIAQLLGIEPMSPSGIVIPTVIPLIIVEQEEVLK